jgi:hypothetical protein
LFRYSFVEATKNPTALRHIGTDAKCGSLRLCVRYSSMLPLSRLATVVVVNAPLAQRNRHYTPPPRAQAT